MFHEQFLVELGGGAALSRPPVKPLQKYFPSFGDDSLLFPPQFQPPAFPFTVASLLPGLRPICLISSNRLLGSAADLPSSCPRPICLRSPPLLLPSQETHQGTGQRGAKEWRTAPLSSRGGHLPHQAQASCFYLYTTQREHKRGGWVIYSSVVRSLADEPEVGS